MTPPLRVQYIKKASNNNAYSNNNACLLYTYAACAPTGCSYVINNSGFINFHLIWTAWQSPFVTPSFPILSSPILSSHLISSPLLPSYLREKSLVRLLTISLRTQTCSFLLHSDLTLMPRYPLRFLPLRSIPPVMLP